MFAVAPGTADDPASNFRLLIDTQTGHIFLADYQV